MSDDLLRIGIYHDEDVFAARQRARAVAGVVGFEMQDQVRVATALSEAGRELVEAGGGSALFCVEAREGHLEVFVIGRTSWRPEPPSGQRGGLAFAHRLMDWVAVERSPEATVVRMRKTLPAARKAAWRLDLTEVRRRLSLMTPPSPLEELRVQNQELLDALDQLRAKQQELLAVNTELEETNRGVMAMYTQLSEELEETNRGVVALYAELDVRGEQLQRASEAKSRFLANVSHELRTPVNSVLGLCRLMLEPDAEPLTPDQAYQLRLMASSSETLLRLVNELLDLAKAESGRLEVRPELVDLGKELAELEPMFRPLVRPDVSLSIEGLDGLPRVRTDRTLFRHIMGNLLSNALKFTERGKVVVSATLDGDSDVVVSVTDTGVGIEPDHLEVVFEEFVQVPGPLQLQSRGTGLGLPYARRLAEALGGTITAESRPSAGSMFSLHLPMSGDQAAGVVAPGRLRAAAPRKAGTALVVDDDPAFRETLRRMLDGLARKVVEAGDGEEALARLQEAVPDIVFLDLRMPHVQGAEVLRRMAQDPRLARVPVVVLSAGERRHETGPLPGHALFFAKSTLARDDVEQAMAALL